MGLGSMILVFVVVGIVLYLINAFIPMQAQIKTLLNWAVVIILIIWLIQATGILSSLNDVRIGNH